MRIVLHNVPADPGRQATCYICFRNANAQHQPMVHGTYEAIGGRMILWMRKYKCPIGHQFRVQWAETQVRA